VPSEGWYEWVKAPDDPKKKQPYFIRLKSQRPMFFGALDQVHPGLQPHDGDGFVIITAASNSGMVDIHDRRPLVLTADIANEWLDPELSPKRAEKIAKNLCQPTEVFEWYPVGKAVGSVKNQGSELIEPDQSDK
jgi:putative SOS response-associated peptidase YedK